MAETPELQRKFERQKRLLAVLAVLLILTGAALLFLLRRVPLPLRIMAGLGDVFVGGVLLVVIRQSLKLPK